MLVDDTEPEPEPDATSAILSSPVILADDDDIIPSLAWLHPRRRRSPGKTPDCTCAGKGDDDDNDDDEDTADDVDVEAFDVACIEEGSNDPSVASTLFSSFRLSSQKQQQRNLRPYVVRSPHPHTPSRSYRLCPLP